MSKRKAVKPCPTRKRTFVISTDVMMKLAVEAERRGMSKSAVAEAIFAEALRRLVLSDRGRQPGEEESAA